jgi:hypothetical protein
LCHQVKLQQLVTLPRSFIREHSGLAHFTQSAIGLPFLSIKLDFFASRKSNMPATKNSFVLLLFAYALNTARAFVPHNSGALLRTSLSSNSFSLCKGGNPLYSRKALIANKGKGRLLMPGSALSLKAQASQGVADSGSGLGGLASQVNGDWDRPAFFRGFVSAKEDGMSSASS